MCLFEPLSKNDVYKIHLASLDLLESVGIKVLEERTLKLLDEKGAYVNYREKVVKIPPTLVKEMLKRVPSEVRLEGRNPAKSLKIYSGSRTFFASGFAIYIVGDNKEPRPVTRKDVANFTKLSDALDYVDYCVGLLPQDVHPLLSDRYRFVDEVCNTTKHIVCTPRTPKSAVDIIEMAAAVVSDKDMLRKKHIFSTAHCVTSPLQWDKTSLEVLIETAKYEIPAYVISEPMSGGTAPVTLAGTLLLSNTEILSGIVINQVYYKGRPVIYVHGITHVLDLKTAEALTATPEIALVTAAGAQMARYYNIPSAAWISTDSKLCDAQAGYEKMFSTLISMLAGVNIVWGMGTTELQFSVSYEQTLLDNEIVKIASRILKGIEITSETVGLDLIKKMGFNANYLLDKHTLNFYQKEHVLTELADKHSRHKWRTLGAKDIAAKARNKAYKIIHMHHPEPIDKEAEKKFNEILKKAKRDLRRFS